MQVTDMVLKLDLLVFRGLIHPGPFLYQSIDLTLLPSNIPTSGISYNYHGHHWIRYCEWPRLYLRYNIPVQPYRWSMGQNLILQVHRHECIGICQFRCFHRPRSHYLVLASIRANRSSNESEKEVECVGYVQYWRLVSISH
jgi:hypothetical protein